MATITRRKRGSRNAIGPYKRHELLTGEIRYPVLGYDGYGDMMDTDLTAFIGDEMRADWEANRDELIEFWKTGRHAVSYFSDVKPWLLAYGSADTLPWAAGVFDTK